MTDYLVGELGPWGANQTRPTKLGPVLLQSKSPPAED
jgi:hypothetical protein